MPRDQRAEAQQILDELFSEHVLPFKLSACQVESIGSEEYIVRFHDSRFRSIDVSWRQGKGFKDGFRAAVLDQMGRTNGRVHGKTSL